MENQNENKPAVQNNTPNGDINLSLKPKIELNNAQKPSITLSSTSATAQTPKTNIPGNVVLNNPVDTFEEPEPKEKQEKTNIVHILKNIAKLALILTILAQTWLILDLDKENTHLSKISVSNTGELHAEKQKKINELEIRQSKIMSEVNKIQGKISRKEFSEYHEEIKNIRNLHINWFDSRQNGKLNIGLFDAAEKVKEYFKSGAFKDKEQLIERGNEIQIKDQAITREKATITIAASQTYKRLFYLANELTKQMNAYPFFKNGSLSEFSRQTDQKTTFDSMEFTINLDRQKAEDKDDADLRFPAFKKWISNK